MPQQPKLYIEFISLNTFERGPPKKCYCEVWVEICPVDKEMSFEAKSSFYPFSDAAWLLCLSTNQYDLKKISRGSLKKHFCLIILKSDKHCHKNGILIFFI